MKNTYLLLIAFYLLCTGLQAQTSVCFNFDDTAMGLPAYNQDPIDAFDSVGQPFYGWIVTNGSPSIIATGNVPGFTAASGTQSLLMAACGSNNSEGAAYGYNFQPGSSYQVIFSHRFVSYAGNGNTPIDTVNVILANGLVSREQGGCGPTVPIPAGSQVLFSASNYNDTLWHTDTLLVSNLSNAYSWLWFRINISAAIGVASDFVIDNVCVDQVQPTSVCFDFDDTAMNAPAYNQDPIEVFDSVGQPFYHWIVTSGSPSIFATGAWPGFTAASGTQSLLMAACGSNNSEGAAYMGNFQAGKSYKVTFKQRFIALSSPTNTPIDTINVILANGLVNNEHGGCSATAPIPAGSQVVFGEYNYNDTFWTTQTVLINNLSADYSWIWFRLNIAQNLPVASDFVIDDFCIEEVTNTSSCFDFDDTAMDAPAYNQDPIEAFNGPGQPFQNWIVTSGSPSILATGDLPGFVAASGTQSLLMAACGSSNSEGAAYAYGFEPTANYQITFKYRFVSTAGNGNPPIDTVNVVLANGLVDNEHGGCSATIPIPAGSDVVFTAVNFNDTVWRTDTIILNNLASAYEYLWFRLNVVQSLAVASDLVIDDLCISGDFASGIRQVDNVYGLLIYPNPAADMITVSAGEGELSGYSSISVINMEGQQTEATVANRTDKSLTINTSQLAPGGYVLLLSGQDGNEVKRFTILR